MNKISKIAKETCFCVQEIHLLQN